MKKPLLILFILSGLCRYAIAQDFAYGTTSPEEMDMKNYAGDTSAHAVVLNEFGTTTIGVVTDENIRVIHEYHVKIKIFDNKGFDKGTVEIPAYNYNEDADSYEKIEDITGITYYKDDNGLTQKVELDNQKIYPVRENKYKSTYKFALPGIRNGCVIEYKYKVISPYFDAFHDWHFQGDIPKVYSEYEVHIPALWHYNASLKGSLKLTKNTSTVEPHCFTANGTTCDCSFMVYAMSDVPALVSEDYMTSANNFLSAINFELVDYTNPYNINGAKIKQASDWKQVEYTLKSYLYFGDQLKKKGLFKDRIEPVIAGKTDDLSKAKAIYVYIQQLFKWNEQNGMFSVDGISSALNKHAGNDADINLSLIVALNAAGLNTEAVLLSTRDNGTVNTLYPVINDFNYVIAKVNIGDQSYLLDATDPLLSFGILPLRCLNDKGRVFTLDKPSYWINLSPPQKQKSTHTLDFILQDDGNLKGTLINYSFGYDAYLKRTAIKKFNSTDEYVENLNGQSSKIKILKSEITNLDSLDQPLIEKYDLEVNIIDKLNGNSLIFNPFFWYKISTNPFKLAERSYPVDLGMPSDERFKLTIHLPAQYSVETPPKAIEVVMPDNGGKFLTNYEQDDNSFTFSHIIQLNKPVYNSEEYPYLKELYNKIIQSEKEEIVFKKQ